MAERPGDVVYRSGETLNKEFEANGDTRYIISGGYTCSWKCFLNEVKRREAKKQEELKRKEEEKNNKDNSIRKE